MPLRRLAPALALLAALIAPLQAHAQGKEPAALKLACVQASDRAQQLRVSGKLVAARDTLRTCVMDACPSVVREACAQWLGEITASLPSIVIGAKDGDGRDILDLKVSIDGRLATEHLDGRAVPIDPGRHKMRYEKADGEVLEEEILVGEGTKNRAVSVQFPPKAGAAAAAGGVSGAAEGGVVAGPKVASTGNTVIGSIFAAVGAGALGTALYLDLSTTSNVNTLKTTCGPAHTCSSNQVSTDELDYDLAGVALGVGIVAVGIATYIYLAHPFGTPTTAPAHGDAAPRFRFVPSPHGGGLALTF